jgi:hypothetical protein
MPLARRSARTPFTSRRARMPFSSRRRMPFVRGNARMPFSWRQRMPFMREHARVPITMRHARIHFARRRGRVIPMFVSHLLCRNVWREMIRLYMVRRFRIHCWRQHVGWRMHMAMRI